MLNKLFPMPTGELGQAVMLGMNFAVGMAVFSFAGFYIDQKRGSGAILFTLIGIVLGLGYGAYEVWKVIRILNAQAAEHCRPKPPATEAGTPTRPASGEPEPQPKAEGEGQ